VRARFLVVAVLAVLAACTDAGPRRGPGTVTGTVQSPNGDEGAAVVLLVGEGVVEVRSVGGTDAYATTDGDMTRVVLVNLEGGTLAFELDLADASRPPVTSLGQVAGPDDQLRPDLSAYRVEWGG